MSRDRPKSPRNARMPPLAMLARIPLSLAFAASLLLCFLLFAGSQALRNREELLRLAEIKSQVFAQLLADHASMTLQASDQVLRGISDKVAMEGLTAPSLRKQLAEAAVFNPQIRWLAVVDASGRIVQTSGYAPTRPVDFAAFPPFAQHRDALSSFIADLMPLGNEGVAICLSRRLDSADGKFLGIVTTLLSQDYFRHRYAQIEQHGVNLVQLRDADGHIVSNWFSPEQAADAGKLRRNRLQSQHGANSEAGGQGGGLRSFRKNGQITATCQLSDFAFSVSVHISEDGVLKDWREHNTLGLAVIGGLLLAVSGLAVSAGRQAERRRRAEAELARSEHREELLEGLHRLLEAVQQTASPREAVETFVEQACPVTGALAACAWHRAEADTVSGASDRVPERVVRIAASCPRAEAVHALLAQADIARDAMQPMPKGWRSIPLAAPRGGHWTLLAAPLPGSPPPGALGLVFAEPRDKDDSLKEILLYLASLLSKVVDRALLDERLRLSERRYRGLVEHMPFMVCRFGSDGAVSFMNDEFRRLIPPGPGTEEAANFFRLAGIEGSFDDLKAASDFACESQRSSPTNETEWHRWTVRPLRGESSENLEFQAVGEDVTESKLTYQRLLASLDEKSALLKEIHHRVKNNLQIVISLINIRLMDGVSEHGDDYLVDLRNRVYAMSLVHEAIYKSDDIARIALAGYIRDITRHLQLALGADARKVSVLVEAADASLELERAVPFGMILNELVSNAFKHAFRDVAAPELRITLARLDNRIELLVRDNGPGLPQPLESAMQKSFGLQLVAMLSRQVNGELRYAGSGGACFEISLPAVRAK